MISIMPAKRDELYDISEFLNDCWKATYGQIVDPVYLDNLSVAERYERMLARFDDGIADFYICRDGDSIIGAAVFGKSFTDGYLDDGEITAIYMRHDYIGKGYGHELFSKAEEVLVTKGYSYFVLDVLSGNTCAISFYQKHGYEHVDDRIIKLGERDYPLAIFRKKP
ncbi:MAG: GNAT family N-acetyltransferase [Clostridiales bacterium]|nr:GNAT family N-acetyltransferase [Clostridiales bacterium]